MLNESIIRMQVTGISKWNMTEKYGCTHCDPVSQRPMSKLDAFGKLRRHYFFNSFTTMISV